MNNKNCVDMMIFRNYIDLVMENIVDGHNSICSPKRSFLSTLKKNKYYQQNKNHNNFFFILYYFDLLWNLVVFDLLLRSKET